MRVVAKKAIVMFFTEHQDAKTALEEWYDKTEKAKWQNFAQLKNSFKTADFVGNNRVVFNIRGNNYRLVALVLYKPMMVYIRFLGTHEEYDKIKDIENI